MKIAIASTGLGHVARGVEAWALGLADELADTARYPQVNVTLFAGDKVSRYQGDKVSRSQGGKVVVVRCLKRGDRITRMLARMMPGFTWRWGLKNVYGWEQFTFWLHLAPMLKKGEYDILHTQDAMLAYWCMTWRRRGWIATKEILAHGTEEPGEFLARFDYLQHLAPYHAEALTAES